MRRAIWWSRLVLLAGGLGAAPAPVWAGDYYTCRDAQGQVSMQDMPCPQGTRTVDKKVLADPPPATDRAPAEGGSGRPGRVVLAAPFVDPDWDDGMIRTMLLRARLGKVLASLSNLRTLVMMHYAEHGTYPTGPEDLQLDASTMYTDEIAAIWFGADGAIVAELRPSFGAGKRVALTPKEVLGGAETTWVCAANFPESVFSGLGGPTCESHLVRAPASPANPPAK